MKKQGRKRDWRYVDDDKIEMKKKWDGRGREVEQRN